MTEIDRIRSRIAAYVACEPGSEPPDHGDLALLLRHIEQMRENARGTGEVLKATLDEEARLRAEIVNLKRDLFNAEHAVMVWKSAEHSASSIAQNLGSIADNKQREIEALTAQVHDLRLALAAERLDPDAGTDLDYHLINGVYIRRVEGGHIEVELRDESKGRWRAYRYALGLVVPPWREVWADNARTAMREANKLEDRTP
jgi:hypothetical protein